MSLEPSGSSEKNMDENGQLVRNKGRLVAQGYS